MIVICHGMVKSASSFATQIVLGLIEKHCQVNSGHIIDLRRFLPDSNGLFVGINENIDSIAQQAIKEFDESQNDFLVIKTHNDCQPYIKSLIEDGRAVAISTFRNPIDIALSLCDAAKIDIENGRSRFNHYRTIDDTIPAIDWQIDCFKSWVLVSGVQLIYFDDIAVNPLAVGERIANTLSIKWESEVVLNLLNNKKDLIWEFNQGNQNRRLVELECSEIERLNNYWCHFADFIEAKCGVKIL